MTTPTYKFKLDRETHDELKCLIEDSVEFFCDEYQISGELTWLIIECLATAKIAQFGGEVI